MIRGGFIRTLALTLLFAWPLVPAKSDELNDLSHDEIRLNAGISQVETPAAIPRVFGRPDGQLCVLYQQGFRLQALHSDDEGLTFEPAVDVAGPPVSEDVFFHDAVLADDGSIWVAVVLTMPGGVRCLYVVHSEDMGRTWSEPLPLATYDLPEYGLSLTSPWRHLAIDAVGPSLISIAYYRTFNQGIYVTTSTNGGADWTEPVRADAPTGSSYWTYSHDLAIDRTSGIIHVAFSQAGGYSSSWDQVILTTRSLDSGVSFEPVRSLEDLAPGMDYAYNTDLAVAPDGSVLLITACSVTEGWSSRDKVLVFQSSDAGLSFDLAFAEELQYRPDTRFLQSRVAVDPSTSTALIAFPDGWRLRVARSGDNGSTFGASQTLEGSYPDPWNPEELSISRTAAGNWAIAWIDLRGTAGPGDDLYLRTSTDDGVTWGPEVHVNSFSESIDEPWGYANRLGLTAVGDDAIVAVYPDNRNDDRRYLIRRARIPGSDPSLLMEGPLEMAGGTVEAPVAAGASLATAADRLYAIMAIQDGPGTIHWYLRKSGDGGQTFSEASQAGPETGYWPYRHQLAATEQGLYLVYIVVVPDGWSYTMQLRFNRSLDDGLTWLEEDVIVAEDFYSTSHSLIAGPDNRIQIVFADSRNHRIYHALSEDAGDHFAVSTVDTGDESWHYDPVYCVAGDKGVLAWRIGPYSSHNSGIYARISEDGGVNFSEPVHLQASLSAGSPGIACNEDGEAIVAWMEYDSHDSTLFSAHFDDAGWQIEEQFEYAGRVYNDPLVAYTTEDADHLLVIWQNNGTSQIAAAFSNDGGATFPVYQLLDDTLPDPDARSYDPQIATDMQGNVWVAWEDRSMGNEDSIVMRRSNDGGATWEPARRVNRESPPGTYSNQFAYTSVATAALPGTGFFTWLGERDSWFSHALFNLDTTVNAPPVADAGGDTCVECQSPSGAIALLDGSSSTDSDSTPGTNDDIVNFEWFESDELLGTGEMLEVTLPLGTHVITLRVTDSAGETDADEVIIAVLDTTPPEVSVEAVPDLLWPPNHRMVDIEASVIATDICSVPSIILEEPILSSEPDDADGVGDGETINDIQDADYGTPDINFSLRAERAGSGDGRTYTVTYSATDPSGNSTPASAMVYVPHSMGHRERPETVGQTGEGVQELAMSGNLSSGTEERPHVTTSGTRNSERRHPERSSDGQDARLPALSDKARTQESRGDEEPDSRARSASENIARHLSTLTDRATSETARRDSIHTLLNVLGESSDLETKLQIARGLVGKVDVSLNTLLAEHLATIRDEAKSLGKQNLVQQAELLLNNLEHSED